MVLSTSYRNSLIMAQITVAQHYRVYESSTHRVKTYQARKQQEKMLEESRGERQADPCVDTALLNVRHRPATVVLIGHSFLKRAQTYLNRRYGFYNNLNIDHHICQIFWEVKGGMLARHLYNDYLSAVMNHLPDIVYVEIGSNDLCDPDLVPADPALEVFHFVTSLLNLGVAYVLVGQVLFRQGSGIPYEVVNYNTRVTLMNNLSAAFLTNEPQAHFWKHRGMWNPVSPIMARDGIHLNSWGNFKYCRSLRQAIRFAVRRIQHRLVQVQQVQQVQQI